DWIARTIDQARSAEPKRTGKSAVAHRAQAEIPDRPVLGKRRTFAAAPPSETAGQIVDRLDADSEKIIVAVAAGRRGPDAVKIKIVARPRNKIGVGDAQPVV